MNKTLKYALGAVLTAALVAPAFGQSDNFPDVPDNHWAYEALARLKKDGLLVGYPDGLFRGNRPASRYELAVAIHATYTHLKSITDGLQSQIDALKGGRPDDVQALRDAIAQLQNDVNNMKGWGADIDNLKRLADQFQKELASLGVDVEGLKRDLADLARRVGVLEAHRLPIDIHGSVSGLFMDGRSQSKRAGITVDGRPVGVDPAVGQPVAGGNNLSLDGFSSPTVYHEMELRLNSNNERGPRWHGTVVIGNMVDSDNGFPYTNANFSGFNSVGRNFLGGDAFPNQSRTGEGPFSEAGESVYIQDLAVDFDSSIAGRGFSAELGRTGYSIDPYIFQRPDVMPYLESDRWSNGKWYFDGGILGFHFGGVKLDIFAGRQSWNFTNTDGTMMNTMTVGTVGHVLNPGVSVRPVGLQSNNPGQLSNGSSVAYGIPVDSQIGANLNIPITTNGRIDLAYIWFNSYSGLSATAAGLPVDNQNDTNMTKVANRASVFGGDLKWNFGNIVLKGGYSQSQLMNGNHTITNSSKDNYEWHGSLAWDAPRWGVQVGYRQIEPQFGAPGDWGRIGMWWNPTDIEGPEASVRLNLTDKLKITASGEWDEGTGTHYAIPAAFGGGVSAGLNHNDRIQDYKIDLGYRLSDAWNVSLGAELVNWDLQSRTGATAGEAAFTGGKPTERWYNIGVGYNFSDMARLNLLLQISDYDSKGIFGFAPFGGFTVDNAAQTRATGDLLTAQLTVKF
jgi:predicted porin